MSPPPRQSSNNNDRNSSKGRGRGNRGNESHLSSGNPAKTRGFNLKKRNAGRGNGGTISSLAPAASVRPTRTMTTVLKKLMIRNLPPTVSEQEVKHMLEGYGVGHDLMWRFVPGSQRNNNRAPRPARMYLDLKNEPETSQKLIGTLHGQLFEPEMKDEGFQIKPLDVEFAPFQKIPREKQRKDAKMGTIDRDPEYMAFVEELAKPKDKLPSAETVVDMAEGETVEKPVAALVKYLNERKVHSRDKGKGKLGGKAIVKNTRRQKGKKADAKQKASKDKLKLSKNRKKKSSGDAVDLKSRKQRGRASLKKEPTKQEPAEPGMLRIMTPKSVAGGSSLTPAAKSSTDAPLERGSEKRCAKSGKKNGSRGRTNVQKSNDGVDGADDEGASMKPHSRRKGGHGGKKEFSSKGERKKVFAPKDATAQGTPSKS